MVFVIPLVVWRYTALWQCTETDGLSQCRSNESHLDVRLTRAEAEPHGRQSWSILGESSSQPLDGYQTDPWDYTEIRINDSEDNGLSLENQALSNSCTTSCPGPCPLQTGPLQCSSGWTSIIHNQTSTNDWERRSMTSTSPNEFTWHLSLSPLATGCGLYQIQDIASKQNSHRLYTLLISLALKSLRPLQKPEIDKWATSCGTIPVRNKIQNCRTFSFTVSCWWNDLPNPIWNAESLTTFKKHLKTHLFLEHLSASYWKQILYAFTF